METPDDAAARNVARVRADRRLTVRQLAARLAESGHPILASGVNKLENGQRRMDVGDLVALAVALGVSPVTLLMPAGDTVQLTPEVSTGSQAAWRWAVGEQPLIRPGDEPIPATDPRMVEHIQANRPFEQDVVTEVIWFLQKRLGAVPFTVDLRQEEGGRVRGGIRIGPGNGERQ